MDFYAFWKVSNYDFKQKFSHMFLTSLYFLITWTHVQWLDNFKPGGNVTKIFFTILA